jgi:hypothetical protein
MKRERKEYRKPYGRGDYELLRRGDGLYWQGHHGLVLRLAAREWGTEMEIDCRQPEDGLSSEVRPALFAG